MDPIDSLISDVDFHVDRAKKLKGVELRKELTENIFPWLKSFAQGVSDALARQQEAIDELIDNEDSYLHPEAAATISGIIHNGRRVAGELMRILESGELPDEQRKQQLVKALQNHEQASVQALEEVAAMTPDADDYFGLDQGEGEGEQPDDESNEGTDDSAGEAGQEVSDG